MSFILCEVAHKINGIGPYTNAKLTLDDDEREPRFGGSIDFEPGQRFVLATRELRTSYQYAIREYAYEALGIPFETFMRASNLLLNALSDTRFKGPAFRKRLWKIQLRALDIIEDDKFYIKHNNGHKSYEWRGEITKEEHGQEIRTIIAEQRALFKTSEEAAKERAKRIAEWRPANPYFPARG